MEDKVESIWVLISGFDRTGEEFRNNNGQWRKPDRRRLEAYNIYQQQLNSEGTEAGQDNTKQRTRDRF